MNNPSEKEMLAFSEKLNLLWREQKMNDAKKLLLTELEKYPNEYFLYTSLAQTCSGLGEYASALEFSQKAINIRNDDVLVLYNHVTALIETEAYKEALSFCQQILRMSVGRIARNGEEVKWAKSIRNDTMYLKSIALFKIGQYSQALRIMKQLLTLRQRGLYSDYSKRQIMKKIKIIEITIAQKKKNISHNGQIDKGTSSSHQ